MYTEASGLNGGRKFGSWAKVENLGYGRLGV